MRQYFSRLAPFLALAFAALLPAGAQAADPTYTVSGIHVDATAASAVPQRRRSRSTRAGRAPGTFSTQRIAKQSDWAKEPKLDIARAARPRARLHGRAMRGARRRALCRGRYLHLQSGSGGACLAGLSPGYVFTQARRILLIPMSPTFQSVNSNWAEAFSSPRFGGSLVPFAVPSGSAPDVVALSRLQFDATNWADVELVAADTRRRSGVWRWPVPHTRQGAGLAEAYRHCARRRPRPRSTCRWFRTT